MKTSFLSLLLAAIVCLTAVTTSCIYDPQAGQVVVTENICVNMTEYQTDGNLSSRAVSDKYRERLLEAIASYGATLDDISDISVVSAKFKLASLKSTKHDWTASADVYIHRQDVSDGPEQLISFSNVSLADYKGPYETAVLDGDGVDLINRALDDLLEGADPVLILDLMNFSIDPVPTMDDPLQLNWIGCITFQAVVDVSVSD
jgi:hypothetical protein